MRWGVAGNIILAWILTLPAAAAVGGLTYAVAKLFGNGALGPVIISVVLLSGLAVALSRRVQQTSPAPAT